MDALSLLMIIGPALLVIAMPYFLIYSFFRLGLKSDKTGIKRWTGSTIFVVVVGLIFYGDILFSSVQLARLCHTKAGIYVYKRIMVPDEMWDFEKNQLNEEHVIDSDYLDEIEDQPFVIGHEFTNEHWGIRTARSFYDEHKTGDRLVEQFDYSSGAGWFAKSIPFASAPKRSCTTDQALKRRYDLEKVSIKENFLFEPSNRGVAFKYAVHPKSYIKPN